MGALGVQQADRLAPGGGAGEGTEEKCPLQVLFFPWGLPVPWPTATQPPAQQGEEREAQAALGIGWHPWKLRSAECPSESMGGNQRWSNTAPACPLLGRPVLENTANLDLDSSYSWVCPSAGGFQSRVGGVPGLAALQKPPQHLWESLGC